jgi:hypothetical protein
MGDLPRPETALMTQPRKSLLAAMVRDEIKVEEVRRRR